jgi:hypothetical protein
VITKEGEYYTIIGSSTKYKKWILVKNVDNESRHNLLESEYKASNPLIPFLFNRPPGTVIDHFYTSRFGLYLGGSSRYAVYYVLLDGGTLWSWSDPLSLDYHRFFNLFCVIYAVIVFVVTGVILLVMKLVGSSLSFRKQNQFLLLMFISLFIAPIILLY